MTDDLKWHAPNSLEQARARVMQVSEVFGPTIQGEGRNTGQLASFLRLAGCNLACSWCDSPYTWDWSRFDRHAEVSHVTVGEVAERLDSMPGRIVVTGGEPLIQAHAIASLMDVLPHRLFDLETNGTRPLGVTQGRWSTITCSPKVIPSSVPLDSSILQLRHLRSSVLDPSMLSS